MDVDQVFRSRSNRATDSVSLITPSQPDAGHGPQRSAGRASKEIEEIRLQCRMGAHQNGDAIDARRRRLEGVAAHDAAAQFFEHLGRLRGHQLLQFPFEGLHRKLRPEQLFHHSGQTAEYRGRAEIVLPVLGDEEVRAKIDLAPRAA